MSLISHDLLTCQEDAPPVFTELLELTEYNDGVREWKEVARWGEQTNK